MPKNSKGAGNPSSNGPLPLDRFLTFYAVAVLGCLVDLLTKHWMFQWRGYPRPHNEYWIWEPFVGIETAVNTGALFGMGGGYGRIFAILSIFAAFGILFWLFYLRAAHDRWLTVALGCVMAGILGNLYDRLGLWVQADMPAIWQSAVRDWILLRYRGHTWPNFNIADSFLVCGAIMLMWHAFREQKASSENPEFPAV